MSNLKKDIEELLEDMPNAWCVDCEHPICLDKKELATTQIINLIESVIPEEKKDDIPGVIFNQAGIAYFDGWNECIADIKSKLIGKE